MTDYWYWRIIKGGKGGLLTFFPWKGEMAFKSSFSFSDLLFKVVVAKLYHVNDIFRVTVDVIWAISLVSPVDWNVHEVCPPEMCLTRILYWDNMQKSREAYLIERGKTLEPLKYFNTYISSFVVIHSLFLPFAFIYTIFTFQISFISQLQRFLFPYTFKVHFLLT